MPLNIENNMGKATWAIAIATIILCIVGIYRCSMETPIVDSKNPINIVGILVSELDSKPVVAKMIKLRHDLNNTHGTIKEDGSFFIEQTTIPVNQTIQLIVHFINQEIKTIDINLRNTSYNVVDKTVSLGVLKIKPPQGHAIPPSSEDGNTTKPKSPNYLRARVDTYSTQLRMRDSPSLTGTVIYRIPRLETVNVIRCDNNVLSIRGVRGKWCWVSHGAIRDIRLTDI